MSSEKSFHGIRDLVGTEFLVGDWIPITQERIDAFADATGDRHWIHTDRERAARGSPFGTTIAHGYLTVSLLPQQTQRFFSEHGVARTINYGCDKIRFPAPVLSGTRIRAHFSLMSAEDVQGGLKLTVSATVEAENQDRPVCYAETISMVYPDNRAP
jgi:acyl dehydratase